jgi:hypothetical protein
MNSLPIVALIGMAVLVTATVGFGNTLATSPDFNFIAASDNNAVTAARGNVTELVWTEEVGLHGEIETDLITFTVGNEDGISGHAFNICAVIQFDNVTGTFFSPPAIVKQIKRVPNYQSELDAGKVFGPCKVGQKISSKTNANYWCLLFQGETGY